MSRAGRIRVGIGGWTYAPWRKSFYPPGLAHARELHHASRQLTAIEINSTFYRTQSASTFAKWRDETPDDFVFAVKAPRYATHRTVLADARAAIERFMASGVLDLGAKLGPILWQFAPTKRFDAADFERFLELLPRAPSLRHALEPRHASFMCEEFIALARQFRVATVYTDSEKYPSYADLTSDFAYARLMRSEAAIATGYPARALDAWAGRALSWAQGKQPDGLHTISKRKPAREPRDVFIFMIDGAKERAPAAAQSLIGRLKPEPGA
ncbi:MAG TPA: DUF72 domain-containing protein [Burkholderiales bacterium]|nr:DUF72 domain-containing protein [Burkholderiales bacterium]